jgi:hypothetical protein
MPAITQIDGLCLRPHIVTSSKSSFNEDPMLLDARGGGIYQRFSGHFFGGRFRAINSSSFFSIA